MTGSDCAALLSQAGVLSPHLPVQRIDTHAATIVLNGDRAWKMKQPVRFRFLDFSTVERRHDALKAELCLNRRIAPNLYLGLHAIRRDRNGTISLDPDIDSTSSDNASTAGANDNDNDNSRNDGDRNDGETLDWVLEMVRFPDDALLVHRAVPGGLDDRLLRELAEHIAELHAGADICDDPQGAARLQDVVDGNLGSMSRYPEIIDPTRATELTGRLTAMIGRSAGLLDTRARAGRVRHCHGDLHLGNIAMIDGAATPFDCLEFDPELATTDVLYDVAFLAMDLWVRGLRHEANVVINTYVDHSPADEAGFALMPLLMSVRASVRAHVSAAADSAGAARDYLDLALHLTESVAPRLVAIGGGSGTGKSTVARAVGGEFGVAPGARILRSDVLRKRLAGVTEETALPSSAYTPAASARVYGELHRLAADCLDGGVSVIADAVYGRASSRDSPTAIAARAGCAFTGIWLELPEAERIRRIENRGPDASDATADVARRQSTTIERPSDWHVVDATDPLPAVRHLLHEK